MKKIVLIVTLFIVLKSFTSYCQTPPVVSVVGNPVKEFEYKCYSNQESYVQEFTYYIITDLVYNANYLLDLEIYEPEAFDYVTYHPSQGFVPNGAYYKWTYQNSSTAYIDVTFYGSYSNLDLYSTESMRFSIQKGLDYDTATTCTHVVTPMNISGPKLACSNPVSFYLNEMPTQYASATWIIKQGTITRASGSGITATANNLSNGNGIVIFTVEFECGLQSLEFEHAFHFGPYSSSDYPISGPSSAPCQSWASYSIPQLEAVTSINWTWPQGWTYNSGQGTRYLALNTGLYSGVVMVGVNNDCGQSGSYANIYTSIYGYCGYGFSYYPSPASNEITITINEPENIDKEDNDILSVDDITYTVRIYNRLGTLVSSAIRTGTSFDIPLPKLRDGTYIIELSDDKKSYRELLIIKHE